MLSELTEAIALHPHPCLLDTVPAQERLSTLITTCATDVGQLQDIVLQTLFMWATCDTKQVSFAATSALQLACALDPRSCHRFLLGANETGNRRMSALLVTAGKVSRGSECECLGRALQCLGSVLRVAEEDDKGNLVKSLGLSEQAVFQEGLLRQLPVINGALDVLSACASSVEAMQVLEDGMHLEKVGAESLSFGMNAPFAVRAANLRLKAVRVLSNAIGQVCRHERRSFAILSSSCASTACLRNWRCLCMGSASRGWTGIVSTP